MIELDNGFDRGAKIRVVGVGGGGGNAVNSMIKKGLHGVDFFAVNTDLQALQRNAGAEQNSDRQESDPRSWCGRGSHDRVPRGGGRPRRNRPRPDGKRHGVRDRGHGRRHRNRRSTARGQHRKSLGALVVGIVTRPFQCEGKKRTAQAEQGHRRTAEAGRYADRHSRTRNCSRSSNATRR